MVELELDVRKHPFTSSGGPQSAGQVQSSAASHIASPQTYSAPPSQLAEQSHVPLLHEALVQPGPQEEQSVDVTHSVPAGRHPAQHPCPPLSIMHPPEHVEGQSAEVVQDGPLPAQSDAPGPEPTCPTNVRE